MSINPGNLNISLRSPDRDVCASCGREITNLMREEKTLQRIFVELCGSTKGLPKACASEIVCSTECAYKWIKLLEDDFLGVPVKQWTEEREEERLANKRW